MYIFFSVAEQFFTLKKDCVIFHRNGERQKLNKNSLADPRVYCFKKVKYIFLYLNLSLDL